MKIINPKLQVSIFSFIVMATVAFPLSRVYAHVLKTDGSIGAILHIDPNDDPVALQPAYFFFEFKDRQNKFDPKKCNCLFTITDSNNKQIFSQGLFQNNPSPDLNNSSVIFTFPNRDVYEVRVMGKPFVNGDFQPFTLTYDVRVDQTADNTSLSSNHSSNFLYIGTGAVIILAFSAGIFLSKKRGGEKDKKN